MSRLHDARERPLRVAAPTASEDPTDRSLFDLLCEELGYEQSDLLVIGLERRKAIVSFTEPSRMPRSTAHVFEQDGGPATSAAA